MLEESLKQGFAELGLPLTEEMAGQYRTYHDLLEETNKVMNLTAITGEDEIARLHFLDCAALLHCVDFKGKKVIDVGTGAGFPGLALKIALPEMELTLLDSLDKRIGFLNTVCSRLQLKDTECIHARAEEIPAVRREAFDIATARAVASLNILAELCLPYVKKGGCFIAMKGPDCEDEVKAASEAIRLLGAKVEKIEKYKVPGTDIIHSAVILRKTGKTAARYPRRWAMIKKAPL